MPTRTRLLDYGNFVCSPNLPPNPAFSEYLGYADRLLAEWRQAEEEWKRSPFSPEPERRKRALDAAVSGFVASFNGRYGIKRVEQDAAFLPFSQFLAEYRPLRKPFSVLHCNLGLPLHTVRTFDGYADLAGINAALDEKKPLGWWQSGPHGQPCYLFGECVWELKPSEAAQSDEGRVLLFLQRSDEEGHRREWLSRSRSQIATDLTADFIPEKLRVLVLRRDRRKCVQCGSQEQLEFDYIVPPNRGGSCTPKNLQMLCNRCWHQKHGTVD